MIDVYVPTSGDGYIVLQPEVERGTDCWYSPIQARNFIGRIEQALSQAQRGAVPLLRTHELVQGDRVCGKGERTKGFQGTVLGDNDDNPDEVIVRWDMHESITSENPRLLIKLSSKLKESADEEHKSTCPG